MLANRLDFWNDPERWDGISDPHKEMFWMKRRVDRIDVRSRAASITNPYTNVADQYLLSLQHGLAMQQASAGLLNSYSYAHARAHHSLSQVFGGLLG